MLNTSDLRERAKLSLRYLTSMVDRSKGCLPYWGVYFDTDPPHAEHTRWDTSELPGSWVDALIMLRNMTGSDEGIEVEEKLKELLLSYFGAKGLRYNESYPWSEKVYCSVHEQGYILNGLLTWYLDSKEKRVKDVIDKLIKGLSEVSIYQNAGMGMMIPQLQNAELGSLAPSIETLGYRFFPHEVYTPSYGWELSSTSDVLFNSVVILALVNYYEETGDEGAGTLAREMINYIVYYSKRFDYDGRFAGHFHATIWVTAGVLKYGILTGDEYLISWAKRVYDWADKQGSSFGWFPENVGIRHPRQELSETCCIADMIQVALLLIQAGYEEYWDDVDRFVRNQLVEHQFIKIPEGRHKFKEGEDTGRSTYRNVLERALGGFWVLTLPNDGATFLAGCCCATGPRALRLVWDNIVAQKQDGIYVNLALDHRTRWLDIQSHYPHSGRLELTIHDAPTVLVRFSDEWVRTSGRIGISAYVDEKPAEIEWRGNYLKLTRLESGGKVTILHPLFDEGKVEIVGGRRYRLLWRGNTVIGISPSGEKFPLYERR